jgi:hypothetical protein
MLGPSIILLAASLGSGEFILWPYMTVRYGFGVFWGALLGIGTQFFINMEIARYTLATGEGVTTGFARLSRHFAWIFAIAIIGADMWPGWATGAGVALSFVVGGNPTIYAVAGLLATGLVLSVGPVIYRTLETVELMLVGIVLATLVFASLWVVKADSVVQLGEGLMSSTLPVGMDMALFLGALAFAGAGGPTNLAQSNYVKDKGYGMGAYIGRLVSPLTGRDEAVAEIGYRFPQTPENLNRWRRWWKAANWEHFLVFLAAGSASMVLLCLIAYSTVQDSSVTQDMGFIRTMADTFAREVGPWFSVLYLVMGMAVLYSTEIAVVDILGRLVAEIVKVNYLRERARPTQSELYLAVVWTVIGSGILILVLGFEEPLALIVVSAALGGSLMFLYSGLLIGINFRLLRGQVRMSRTRLVLLIWAVCFYGYFTLRLLWSIPVQLSS